MNWELRPIAVADTDAVIGLWREVFPQYDDPARPQRAPRINVERKLAQGDGLFWGVWREGRLLGTAMAGWDGHRGWLYAVGVAPDARGQGVARALVTHAERELAAQGCPKVNLQVLDDAVGALAFWRALGYAPDPVTSLGKRL